MKTKVEAIVHVYVFKCVFCGGGGEGREEKSISLGGIEKERCQYPGNCFFCFCYKNRLVYSVP